MLIVMSLCKQIPRMRVRIDHAETGEVLFEGFLEDCPYKICEMEIEKLEAKFSNGTDYIIFAE